MDRQQQEQLLALIFNDVEISDHIRNQFELWLLDHEQDAELNAMIEQLWNRHPIVAPDKAIYQGLERLHASIQAPRKRLLPARLIRIAGVAALIAVIFTSGYFTAWRTTQTTHETITLLAAKDNVGKYTLPDGSVVWLNGESKVSYDADFSGAVREVALQGEAFFEVHRDTLRPFHVLMNGALDVEVLGTSFDAIAYDEGDCREVILKSGSVKVSGESLRKAIYLKPNEKLSFDLASRVVRIEQVDAQNYCQWFAPKLTFYNTPLEDIIINLERRYNIDIELSSRVSSGKRLSMTINREPLEDIMEVLAKLTPIQYQINGNSVLIYSK